MDSFRGHSAKGTVQPSSLLKFRVILKWQLTDASGPWELRSYSFSENARGKISPIFTKLPSILGTVLDLGEPRGPRKDECQPHLGLPHMWKGQTDNPPFLPSDGWASGHLHVAVFLVLTAAPSTAIFEAEQL